MLSCGCPTHASSENRPRLKSPNLGRTTPAVEPRPSKDPCGSWVTEELLSVQLLRLPQRDGDKTSAQHQPTGTFMQDPPPFPRKPSTLRAGTAFYQEASTRAQNARDLHKHKRPLAIGTLRSRNSSHYSSQLSLLPCPYFVHRPLAAAADGCDHSLRRCISWHLTTNYQQ